MYNSYQSISLHWKYSCVFVFLCITSSNTKFPHAKKGSSIRIKIPNIDWGRGDSRLIIVVVNITNTSEDEFYQIGNNYGMLT